MRLIQFVLEGARHFGLVTEDHVVDITAIEPDVTSLRTAFVAAQRTESPLETFLRRLAERSQAPRLDYPSLLRAGMVIAPVVEEPPGRVLVSGTGLTHLGSVQQRDAMHKTDRPDQPISDSRKMFEIGLQNGRPAPGQRGAAPEWFYKGDGRILRGPGEPLDIPSFAPDGGEEPEIAVVYIIDRQARPRRLGFTQGNEWSDHVTEKINYLYLAPSKLRTCAIGPELVTDHPFADVRGRCRIERDGRTIYDSGELLTGEANMCHSLANIEDHHFKHEQHRQPGDIHVHFLGTSKLSYQERQWQFQSGDTVEVGFEGFGAPLRNPIRRQVPTPGPILVAPA